MRTKIVTLLLLSTLAGCSSIPLSPHKIEIQQGNLVTQEMVSKLKPGMTRAQVRFVLGSPLILDAFHPDRWDYVYRLEQKGKLVEQRKLTVYFEGDKLMRVEGGFAASFAAVPPAARPGTEIRNAVVPVQGAPAQFVAPSQPALAQPDSTPRPYLFPPQPAATAQPPASPKPVASEKFDITVSSDSVAPGSGRVQPKAADQKEPDQPKKERGFIGKMLEKIGL